MSSYDSKPPRIGLWANERGPMASGNAGPVRYVLWRNERKKNDREPDFHLVLEQAQPREKREPQQGDNPASGGGAWNDEIGFAPEVR